MRTTSSQTSRAVAAIATLWFSAVAAHGLRGMLVEEGTFTSSLPVDSPLPEDKQSASAPFVTPSIEGGIAPSPASEPVKTEPLDVVAATERAPAVAGAERAQPKARERGSRGKRPVEAAVAAPRVASVLAREALRAIGKDPAALVIWLRAINDPNLPSGDRSDLIEDLNDEGYEGRSPFTEGDLQLILARLEIIEQQLPLAMDEVNAVAFTEPTRTCSRCWQRPARTSPLARRSGDARWRGASGAAAVRALPPHP